MKKPVIALAELTACFGCQLTVFCDQELAGMADYLTFSRLPKGIAPRNIPEELDATLVEGAVTTGEDLDMLMQLRQNSRRLIAVGTCARWGGINAGARSNSSPTGPVHRFATIDAAITGCPPEKNEIALLLRELIFNALPGAIDHPVCTECNTRDNICLLKERSALCLGPLIQSGCDARCPTIGVPCEGCRGPAAEGVEQPERRLLQETFSPAEISRRMNRFCPDWRTGGR